jgi:hypothetical protein
MGIDRMISRHVCDKLLTVRLPDRSEGKDGYQPDRKEVLVWYTDGSKTNTGTDVGVYGYGTRQKCMPIKACTIKNLDRGYRNICTVLHAQAVIKALDNYQINSKLVCHQSLMKTGEHIVA